MLASVAERNAVAPVMFTVTSAWADVRRAIANVAPPRMDLSFI
jgi:hypothetical protein